MLNLRPLLALCLAVMLAGCAANNMADQPRYETYEQSDFFPDGMSARPLVDHVVPRNAIIEDTQLLTGRDADGNLITNFPMEVTRNLLERGQERFDIYCSPCHGYWGNGDGMIVQRGFPAPPSYHLERLRNAPNGHFYDVITNGFGIMFDYANRVDVEDRWAIVAYIRALQMSQHVPVGTLTDEQREQLES